MEQELLKGICKNNLAMTNKNPRLNRKESTLA